MKERPILFSTPMVRAILAGLKTQTRRLVKPTPNPDITAILGMPDGPEFACLVKPKYGQECFIECPHGQPGDALWVRERWGGDDLCGFAYAADHPDWPRFQGDGEQPDSAWKVSIHMPRKACRLFLDLVDVRCQKLQDISEADARAEGIRKEYLPSDPDNFHPPGSYGFVCNEVPLGKIWPTPQQAFTELWDSINGDRAPWSTNPWVWVLDFKTRT